MSTPPLSERKHAKGLQIYSGLGPQPFLLSTRMGSHPLLMVDVQVYYSEQEWVHNFTPLLMADVKVYYSQQEWVHTLC